MVPMLPPRRLLHFFMTPVSRAIEVVRSIPDAVVCVVGDITRTQYVDYDRLTLVLELLCEHGLHGVIRHSTCGFDYVTGQSAKDLNVVLYTTDTSDPGRVGLWDPAVLSDVAFVVSFPAEVDKRGAVQVDQSLMAAAVRYGCPVLGVGRTKVSWEDHAYLSG